MADASPEDLARAVGEAMFARDHAARALGIVLAEIGPGHARCRMTVRADMVNGHGTCHGGFTFALADTAFAYACNSYNRATVAQGAHISFIAPARVGDVLIATARERSRSGRTGIYDVEVATADGRLVAMFRGNAYETRGQVAPGFADPAPDADALSASQRKT